MSANNIIESNESLGIIASNLTISYYLHTSNMDMPENIKSYTAHLRKETNRNNIYETYKEFLKKLEEDQLPKIGEEK